VQLLTGTSGFAYPSWKGTFYPADAADDGLLPHYAARLAAVELNNTFYRMPKADVVARWRAQVPTTFTFVVKASKAISHTHKLDAKAIDSMQYLWKVTAGLEAQLGAVLVAPPPYQRADLGKLREFLAGGVPTGRRVAFELPHASWQTDEVDQLIADHGGTTVIADRPDGTARWPATLAKSGWAYVRLRREAYDDAALATWRDRLASSGINTAYVFFKHEETPAGAHLAERLATLP
jgi:uncharacterized protein YecE (DUF72 family)